MNAIQQRILNAIKQERIIAKYADQEPWESGSSTVVYPITLWVDRVKVQIDTKKNYFEKAIQRVIEKNQDLFEYGYFCKSDGSCPSFICFKYTENTIQQYNKKYTNQKPY